MENNLAGTFLNERMFFRVNWSGRCQYGRTDSHTGAPDMICPGSDFDCDNPGCRHGGCQGRKPQRPLLKLMAMASEPAGTDAGKQAGLSERYLAEVGSCGPHRVREPVAA
jgi:hypothetical protein